MSMHSDPGLASLINMLTTSFNEVRWINYCSNFLQTKFTLILVTIYTDYTDMN